MRGLLGVSEAAGILGTEGLFVWYLGALRSAVVCFSEFCWSITGCPWTLFLAFEVWRR